LDCTARERPAAVTETVLDELPAAAPTTALNVTVIMVFAATVPSGTANSCPVSVAAGDATPLIETEFGTTVRPLGTTSLRFALTAGPAPVLAIVTP
jgi:hypothetical protein